MRVLRWRFAHAPVATGVVLDEAAAPCASVAVSSEVSVPKCCGQITQQALPELAGKSVADRPTWRTTFSLERSF